MFVSKVYYIFVLKIWKIVEKIKTDIDRESNWSISVFFRTAHALSERASTTSPVSLLSRSDTSTYTRPYYVSTL